MIAILGENGGARELGLMNDEIVSRRSCPIGHESGVAGDPFAAYIRVDLNRVRTAVVRLGRYRHV